MEKSVLGKFEIQNHEPLNLKLPLICGCDGDEIGMDSLCLLGHFVFFDSWICIDSLQSGFGGP